MVTDLLARKVSLALFVTVTFRVRILFPEKTKDEETVLSV